MAEKVQSASRRQFIKIGGAAIGGAAVASAAFLTLVPPSQDNSKLEAAQKQAADLAAQLDTTKQQAALAKQQADLNQSYITEFNGFLALNPKEQAIVDAVADTMIPSDANGPGAKEAGVIYFIDRQLAGSYGKNGNMFMQGPFVAANQKGPITVGGITYPKGSAFAAVGAGTGYQYAMTLRVYWSKGLQFLDEYSMSAYGAAFETLALDKRTQILNDMFDNKPTNFTGPTPLEFVSEMHDMVLAGFYADPMYGGNRGMVGWKLTGFAGVNSGAFDNLDVKKLMVDTTPTRLTPVSVGQLRKPA